MKRTHDRHNNIVPIDFDNMSKEDIAIYASYRPIRNTKEEAENWIEKMKPIRVDTWTWSNDYYYI